MACVEEREKLEQEEPFAAHDTRYESRSDAVLDHAIVSVVVASRQAPDERV